MINLLLDGKVINELLNPKQLSVGALYYDENEIHFYRTNISDKVTYLNLYIKYGSVNCSLKYVCNKFSTIEYDNDRYYCDRQDFILNSVPYSEQDFNDPGFEFNLSILDDIDYKFFRLFKELRSTRFLLSFP
ncbi:hypothetical protein XaC1_554 [Xanthomonas phage XaC1]|nr:hypothetical protein XaC1_554 [Xanthomonas phage XaC1]